MSSAKREQGEATADTDGEVARERSTHYEDVVRRAGKRINTRRDEAGYSLGYLEEKTGISKATLSRIENGLQREMSAGNFFAICEALALDPLYAWYGDTRKPPAKTPSEPPPSSTRRPTKSPPK